MAYVEQPATEGVTEADAAYFNHMQNGIFAAAATADLALSEVAAAKAEASTARTEAGEAKTKAAEAKTAATEAKAKAEEALTNAAAAKTAAEAVSSVIVANTQTAAYTFVLADAGKNVEFNKAATKEAFTVPPHGTVAFPVGTVIECTQIGTGQLEIKAGAGVTLRTPTGSLTARAQYSTLSLRQRAENEWVVSGDLT